MTPAYDALEPRSALEALVGDTLETTGDRVADALRRAVILRVFPDDRLPPERRLAELLGVSRITVRQGLATLRREGHVRSVGGRGGGTYQVLRRPARGWRSQLQRAWSEIVDILEFRTLIEPLAALQAARHRDRLLLESLRRSIEGMASSDTLEAFRYADSTFHHLIASASGNGRLFRAILLARADLLMWRDRLPIPFRPGANVDEHLRTLDALAAKDGEGAAQAMADHLASARKEFWDDIRSLDAELGQSLTPRRLDGPRHRRIFAESSLGKKGG